MYKPQMETKKGWSVLLESILQEHKKESLAEFSGLEIDAIIKEADEKKASRYMKERIHKEWKKAIANDQRNRAIMSLSPITTEGINFEPDDVEEEQEEEVEEEEEQVEEEVKVKEDLLEVPVRPKVAHRIDFDALEKEARRAMSAPSFKPPPDPISELKNEGRLLVEDIKKEAREFSGTAIQMVNELKLSLIFGFAGITTLLLYIAFK